MSAELPPVARALMVLALAAVTLGFGAIGLCGGYFTLMTIPALLQGHVDVTMFLLISVPCLIGGIAVIKVCAGKMRRLMSASRPPDRPHE